MILLVVYSYMLVALGMVVISEQQQIVACSYRTTYLLPGSPTAE